MCNVFSSLICTIKKQLLKMELLLGISFLKQNQVEGYLGSYLLGNAN